MDSVLSGSQLLFPPLDFYGAARAIWLMLPKGGMGDFTEPATCPSASPAAPPGGPNQQPGLWHVCRWEAQVPCPASVSRSAKQRNTTKDTKRHLWKWGSRGQEPFFKSTKALWAPCPQHLTHSSKSWVCQGSRNLGAKDSGVLVVVFRCDPAGWRACSWAYFGTAVDKDFKFCSGDQLQWEAFYENNTYCRHLNIFPWENKDEGNKKMV